MVPGFTGVPIERSILNHWIAMINVANLSENHPIHVSEEEYDTLKNKKKQGWSNCDSQTEWMVKLHYLRKGFKDGKIPREQFFAKERDLVLNWWRRWC